jgi:hypothetical protein
MTTKVKFKKWNCIVVFHKYRNNNRIAIELADETTNESIAMATINLPHVELNKNTVAIKNYSENEGIVEVLTKAKIIGKRVDLIISGHCAIGIYQLLKNK